MRPAARPGSTWRRAPIAAAPATWSAGARGRPDRARTSTPKASHRPPGSAGPRGWGPRPCFGRTGSRESNIATPTTAPSASPCFRARAPAARAATPSPRRRRFAPTRCWSALRTNSAGRSSCDSAFSPRPRPAERVVGATAPIYTSLTKRLTGLSMKVVEIVPRARTRLYGMLVAKEAAIRQGGRGTYVRVGRKRKDAARWKHRNYRGSVDLKRGDSEVVTAQVRAANPEDERKLLSSFLGFVDRHSGDQVATITIHYR